MKFQITRSSSGDGDEKPCEEAFKDTYLAKGYVTENWEVEDTNVEDWFVEINSLKELIEFEEKYGAIIIGTAFYNDDILEIEIYDSHRE
jgi:hypothetical protein